MQTYEPATLTEQFEDYAGILVFTLPKGFLRWEKKKSLSGAIYAANALFKKDVLHAVNGFDTDFMTGGDFDFCWRLQRAGYRLFFEPEAVVKHVHGTSLRGLVTQFFKYGVEQPRLLKKRPDGSSCIKLKTYLLSPYELRCHLPVRMLLTVDCCSLFAASLLMGVVSPLFLYVALFTFSLVLLGTFREALKVVKKSRKLKWLLLFSLFHLARNYSFTLGRVGGMRHRIVAMQQVPLAQAAQH